MNALSQAIAAGVAWTPLLVLALCIVFALYAGVAQIEAVTSGTSYVVPE